MTSEQRPHCWSAEPVFCAGVKYAIDGRWGQFTKT
jgi:hypothetical protein